MLPVMLVNVTYNGTDMRLLEIQINGKISMIPDLAMSGYSMSAVWGSGECRNLSHFVQPE